MLWLVRGQKRVTKIPYNCGYLLWFEGLVEDLSAVARGCAPSRNVLALFTFLSESISHRSFYFESDDPCSRSPASKHRTSTRTIILDIVLLYQHRSYLSSAL